MQTARSFLTVLLTIFLVGCADTKPVKVTQIPRNLKLEAPDYTVGESALCEVHHIKMTRAEVPISYGLPFVDANALARYAASTNAFPHARKYVLGGCCVSPDSPTNVIVYICPECRKAANEWEANHKKSE